ncbi:MAG: hypothetical protein ACTSRR_08695 [Candidatus Heimdallarchaeaceae archaeon]
MSSAGYFFYLCSITVKPNDEEQYEDFNEFDMHLHLVQEELEKKEPSRDPYLETTFFLPDWVEMNFKFKSSYKDGDEDIYMYIDLVKEEIESNLNVTIVDFGIEGVV